MFSIDKNKKIEYLKKIREKQREKYFSEENVIKRREKAIEYKKKLIQKEYRGLRKFSNKMLSIHEKDTIFYEKIWNERKHYCENCGKFLGNSFKDSRGYIITYRYAHIIPKSVYPYLRHYNKNIMLLCLNCHTKFDNSPKEIVEKMKCYNDEHIKNLKQLHKKLEQENNEIYK